MSTADELEGHFGRTINTVFVTAGGAKLGMATEWNEFEFTTMRAGKHGPAERRIPTMNHLSDVFHNNWSGVKNILNFLIMISKNLL